MISLGFGDMMKEYRKKHNLTQTELAEMMGISKNHYSVLERGEKIPRVKTIEAFQQLVCEEEVVRCMTNAEISTSQRKEYATLLACLDKMEPKKRAQAMNAIIGLLKLM